MKSSDQPYFLNQRNLRLLLFGGKGGVGKTTCAAASALYLSRKNPDDKFLLVSTDPAHSLTDSLADSVCPANLKVLEFDAQEYLNKFIEENRKKFHDIASRGTFLDEDDINKFLNLSLPGMDEVMGFMEMTRWVNQKLYQCIIVDTAPTGHTLRLLTMPSMIRNWLEALDTLLAKHRYMKKVFSGTYKKDELDIFIEDMADSIRRMNTIMKDRSLCLFVPVMLAEQLSVSETRNLLAELMRIRMPVSDVIVNRIFPENKCQLCQDSRSRQMYELGSILTKKEWEQYQKWLIPYHEEEVQGSKSLGSLWDGVERLDKSITSDKQVEGQRPVVVDNPANLPSKEFSLMIFAGKGGVGKTTLACATAVHMAREFPENRILLFSTDPAHSLSDCLDMDIASQPTGIIKGLHAMQIDAEAEFTELKNRYEKELNKFLKSVLSNLDLTFDREVMERIMDLSPPGLDEIMAMTKVMSFIAEKTYDCVILDSAPTGHLIRLLEMPHIIDQWLKVFFNLFLKYKEVFKLPGISKRLIEISKDLKRFCSLINDPGKSALYAVSILTEMSYNETLDLLSACERLGIHVPEMFLNLATPDNKCPFCQAIYRRELNTSEIFSGAIGNLRQTVVYRSGDLRGIMRLEKLGAALYRRD